MYDFRLRFNLPTTYRIASNEPRITLITFGDNEKIELYTGDDKIPLEECGQPAIIGGQYATDSLARTAAEKSKKAFLYWAITQRVGIDFGDGRQYCCWTKEGLDYLSKQRGCRVRNDLHGIDVFEHVKPIEFINTQVTPQLGKYPPDLANTFFYEYNNERNFESKELLACEIYASSFFDVSPRARFITLVTSVEAIVEPIARSENEKNLISKWISELDHAPIADLEKKSFKGALGALNNKSVGQSARELIANTIPGQMFDGKPADQFFGFCYSLRSQLLHNGKLATPSLDIVPITNELEKFVHSLLLTIIK